MRELFDYLKKQLEKGDCPIYTIHPVFGIRENYFELYMKDGSRIRITGE
jgi:hypothetical protein